MTDHTAQIAERLANCPESSTVEAERAWLKALRADIAYLLAEIARLAAIEVAAREVKRLIDLDEGLWVTVLTASTATHTTTRA